VVLLDKTFPAVQVLLRVFIRSGLLYLIPASVLVMGMLVRVIGHASRHSTNRKHYNNDISGRNYIDQSF
jgi:hypothetical protein